MRDERGQKGFEDYPLTRPEYISAMVHFYRGELTRSNTWRIRLDTTSNWAVISAMGVLSFAFGVPDHSHASIVLGMVLEVHFLVLEARRFRFFDVWRNRLRMIEENFYAPLMKRNLVSSTGNWGELIAADLDRPRFKISYLQAFRARFLRNYAPLFIIMLIAWILKVFLHGEDVDGPWYNNMGVGPIIPWYYPLGLVCIIYTGLFCIAVFTKKVKSPELEFWQPDGNPHQSTLDF